MPPDSSKGCWLAEPASRTFSRSSSARARRSLRGTPWRRMGSSTLATAVNQGSRAASWNSMAVRLPPTSMVPLVGWSRPASMWRSVVLPHPDAPTTQTSSPGLTWSVMRSRATTARGPWPKTRVTSSTRTSGDTAVRGGARGEARLIVRDSPTKSIELVDQVDMVNSSSSTLGGDADWRWTPWESTASSDSCPRLAALGRLLGGGPLGRRLLGTGLLARRAGGGLLGRRLACAGLLRRRPLGGRLLGRGLLGRCPLRCRLPGAGGALGRSRLFGCGCLARSGGGTGACPPQQRDGERAPPSDVALYHTFCLESREHGVENTEIAIASSCCQS